MDKLTPREPSEAERLAQALTDWKSREVRDLDRLDAAAELRRLAALSESNAIDALNYESRIERLQAENDALRAMHDAAPKVEAEPVAWMDDFGNAFPLAANKGAGSWLDEHKRNWKPLYTHPAAPQPAARRADGMPASADERHLRRMLAARVGMQHTYFDDGEAQGQEHGIAIDFMRQPVADIDAMLRALNVARYECAAPPPVERAHGIEEVKR